MLPGDVFDRLSVRVSSVKFGEWKTTTLDIGEAFMICWCMAYGGENWCWMGSESACLWGHGFKRQLRHFDKNFIFYFVEDYLHSF